MKTNELKKGDKVRLRNGWDAEILDNMKGNIRLAKVFGHYTEIGSSYAHDILYYTSGLTRTEIIHTPAQLKLQTQTPAAITSYWKDF